VSNALRSESGIIFILLFSRWYSARIRTRGRSQVEVSVEGKNHEAGSDPKLSLESTTLFDAPYPSQEKHSEFISYRLSTQ
jgi:hypothetical protein